MATGGRKTSVVWEFFTVAENSKFAVCNSCEAQVARGGGTTKSFTTTNLVHHLQVNHTEVHKEYLERKANQEPRQPKETRKRSLQRQLSLTETQELTKVWDINDHKAQRVHRRIGEMIAIDCQPLSVVDDFGFRQVLRTLEPRYNCPSRKYYTETIIPKIYEGMKTEVLKLINESGSTEIVERDYVSFTTDAWSSSVNDTALLSLTAHWINHEFKRTSAILSAHSLTESHTGEYIAAQVHSMLKEWEILPERVHVVVTDNASNMTKAMRDASLPQFGCFAHSLQLAINDSLLSQRAVMNMIGVCKSIVGHFNRSVTAAHNLKRIQESLDIPQHKLKQDITTRWNSTFYMLQSIQEQKMALAAYAAENGSVQQLSSNQLDLLKKCIDVLSPIEEITNSISANLASISIIIPYVRILIKTLEKHADDGGIRAMKAELLHSIKSRFSGIEENKILSVATILDPRFKEKFFSGNIIKATIREMLLDEMSRFTNISNATPDNDSEVEEPGGSKRLCPLKSSVLLDVFSEIVADNSEDQPVTTGELDRYLSIPIIDFKSGDPYFWWSQHHKEFPVLSKLACRHLAAPATSVPSERLFSSAGNLHEEKRNKITPQLCQELLFIQNNFVLVGTNYKF